MQISPRSLSLPAIGALGVLSLGRRAEVRASVVATSAAFCGFKAD